jgi:hypothetical protein
MKAVLMATALILCLAADSQENQFNRFVKKESVRWAAYISDTVRFSEKNLSAILRSRIKKGNIVAAEPFSHEMMGTGFKIRYISNGETEKKIHRADTVFSQDSSGVISTLVSERADSQIFDSISNNLVSTEEILFIENGKIYAYIPFVSPAFSMYTNNGDFLGSAAFCTTSFNNDPYSGAGPADKITRLIQTKRRLLPDSIEKQHQLKQLFGENMLEALWPAVERGKIKLYSFEDDRVLTIREISSKMINTNMLIPVYDSTGEIIRNISPLEPLRPSLFKNLEMVQDWFYDYSKNIVFNKIKELVLYTDFDNEPTDKFNKPSFKIIFN